MVHTYGDKHHTKSMQYEAEKNLFIFYVSVGVIVYIVY